jgi:GR25 family glycosyltransferase involved in LPS biosynthesis
MKFRHCLYLIVVGLLLSNAALLWWLISIFAHPSSNESHIESKHSNSVLHHSPSNEPKLSIPTERFRQDLPSNTMPSNIALIATSPPLKSAPNTLPIYWINLDQSQDRFLKMRDMFRSKFPSWSHRRIKAAGTRLVNKMIKNGQLKMSGSICFHGCSNLYEQHLVGKYSMKEVAVTISHLIAIKKAYDEEQDIALIMEDDVKIYEDFSSDWKKYISLAPDNWRILQMLTINEKSVLEYLEGILHSPFVPYFPEHYSTGAYIINRRGMKELLDQTWDDSTFTYTLTNSHKLTLADEMLFMLVPTYTSVYPFFGLRKSQSTVQQNNDNGKLVDDFHGSTMEIIRRMRKMRTTTTFLYPPPITASHIKTSNFIELLVLSVGRISSLKQAHDLIDHIHLNVKALKKEFQDEVGYHMYVVCATASLCAMFQEKWNTLILTDVSSSSSSSSQLVLITEMYSSRFNKFDKLNQLYDLSRKKYNNNVMVENVMIVDDDIELFGFPWREFMLRSRDSKSVITGPLRENQYESILINRKKHLSTDFPFQNGRYWKQREGKHYPSDFEYRTFPTDFLEMFMVMMKNDFAKFIFDKMKPLFKDKKLVSDWGPDLIWCAAARDFMKMNPSKYQTANKSPFRWLSSKRKEANKSPFRWWSSKRKEKELQVINSPCSLIPLIVVDLNAKTQMEASDFSRKKINLAGKYAASKYKEAFSAWYHYSQNFHQKYQGNGFRNSYKLIQRTRFQFPECQKCPDGHCDCSWANKYSCSSTDNSCCHQCCCTEKMLVD